MMKRCRAVKMISTGSVAIKAPAMIKPGNEAYALWTLATPAGRVKILGDVSTTRGLWTPDRGHPILQSEQHHW